MQAMFRAKRGDTLIASIERRYGIDLNARSDATLGALLAKRGFDSLSQLLAAYYGRANRPARKRRLFLSFDADDRAQVAGFRLLAHNPRIEVDFSEASLRAPINSERASYLKQVLRRKITQASVLVCLIGNATAWSAWVDWEIRTAQELRKGVCGVRLKGSRGRTPRALNETGAPIARWDTQEIISSIECSAARRS